MDVEVSNRKKHFFIPLFFFLVNPQKSGPLCCKEFSRIFSFQLSDELVFHSRLQKNFNISKYVFCVSAQRIGFRGGYLKLLPEDKFEERAFDFYTPAYTLPDNLSSDILMALDASWTFTGWVRGFERDFNIILKCTNATSTSEDYACYGIGIRKQRFAWVNKGKKKFLF